MIHCCRECVFALSSKGCKSFLADFIVFFVAWCRGWLPGTMRQNSGMESCLQFGKHLAGIKDDFACGGGHVGAGEIIGGAQVDDGALQSIGRSRNHGHLRIRFARDEYGIGFTDAGDDDFPTVFARVAYCQDTHAHIFDDVTQKGRMAPGGGVFNEADSVLAHVFLPYPAYAMMR